MVTDRSEQIDVILEHVEALQQLSVMFFDHNCHTIYRSIAGPLRFLLVGSSGDKGLVEEVIPDASFHPLKIAPEATAAPGHLTVPSDVRIVRNNSKIFMKGGAKVQSLNVAGGAMSAMSFETPFDLSRSTVPISDWLAQPFLRFDRTLGNFITTVANKDGVAHLNTTSDLLALKRWGHMHWHLVAHHGRYIAQPIEMQIKARFPEHVRAVR